MVVNRREFLTLTTLAALKTWIPNGITVSAQSGLTGTVLIRAGARLGSRLAGGIAGLVVTEVVLGILKAYDIDIAGFVEKAVRDFRGQEPGRSSATKGQRRVIVDAPEPLHRAPAPTLYLASGTCGPDSELHVRYDGYEVRIRQHGAPVWSLGLTFWGATRDLEARVSCLKDTPCGHPVQNWVSRDQFGKNYRYLEQQFEGGVVRLVIDLNRPRTLEEVYERNRGLEIWFPAT